MHISLFEAVGPIMIGPSSSHTAGAARLARVAALLAGGPFSQVCFGLHGSFASTYKGHGTDRALVAGVLQIKEDDERLAAAFSLAEKAGLSYSFQTVELQGVHENTVQITFTMADGRIEQITGSSIGGGQILITSINGFESEITAQLPTLVIRQHDRPGVIQKITSVLADHMLNIGTMRVSRTQRGDVAMCVIQTDSPIPEALVREILTHKDILDARSIQLV